MFINLVLGPKGQALYRKYFNEQSNRMKRLDYIDEQILGNIKYKDWIFTLKTTNDLIFVFATFTDKEGKVWNSRKFYISEHMTESEIVQTVFLAIKTAEEHELREEFKFKGAAIFGPHWDCNQLADMLAGDKGDEYLDVRD